MGLDEQVARHVLDFLHHLPVELLELGVLLVVGRRADQRHDIGAEVTRGPDRTELRMHEVGATTRMRNLGGVDQGSQLAEFEIHRGDLVRRALAATRK